MDAKALGLQAALGNFCYVLGDVFTWTPKVCKIMAFMASILGLGPLFYILLGSHKGHYSGFRTIILHTFGV